MAERAPMITTGKRMRWEEGRGRVAADRGQNVSKYVVCSTTRTQLLLLYNKVFFFVVAQKDVICSYFCSLCVVCK